MEVVSVYSVEQPWAEQQREVAELVRQGPDLAEHGVVRWRRIDRSRVIERRYGVKLAERSVGALHESCN
jgi:hypothetical protein